MSHPRHLSDILIWLELLLKSWHIGQSGIRRWWKFFLFFFLVILGKVSFLAGWKRFFLITVFSLWLPACHCLSAHGNKSFSICHSYLSLHLLLILHCFFPPFFSSSTLIFLLFFTILTFSQASESSFRFFWRVVFFTFFQPWVFFIHPWNLYIFD